MKENLKTKCSLEEEYAFERRQRIKAEAYISELWEMNQELVDEVIKLQKEINKDKPLPKEKPCLTGKIKLQNKIEKIIEERDKRFNNLGKLIKKAFK